MILGEKVQLSELSYQKSCQRSQKAGLFCALVLLSSVAWANAENTPKTAISPTLYPKDAQDTKTPNETAFGASAGFDDESIADELSLAPVSVSDIERKLVRLQSQSNTTVQNTDFSTFQTLGSGVDANAPVSRIDGVTPPVGLELSSPTLVASVTEPSLPTSDTTDSPENVTVIDDEVLVVNNEGIDPDAYLPDTFQNEALPMPDDEWAPSNVIERRPNLIQRAYSRIFNDGVLGTTRLRANVYLASAATPESVPEPTTSETPATEDDGVLVDINQDAWQYESDYVASLFQASENSVRTKADMKLEPFANIKAAIENITTEQTPSFSVALPRLKDTVTAAARAVGYYDVQFYLENAGNGEINVVIYDLGKPVVIASEVMDVRGEGENFPDFLAVQNQSRQSVGEVFHHGEYDSLKSAINTAQATHGFFDGKWLDHSVDVILPDNTADVSLVYETGTQYAFDEVVFFTIDPDTGELTTDPDKLPVEVSLLKKLVSFETGEGFDRRQLNQLSADLMATRYFNATNVEAVFPESPTTTPTLSPEALTDQATLGQTVTLDEAEQIQAEIAPIDFSPSEGLLDKLALVKTKAARLSNSPDDRVLGESGKSRSTSLLGRVSDAVSGIVKTILPDESADELPELPEGVTPPVLAGRKSPEAVFLDKKVPLYVFVLADKPKDAQIGLGWGSDTGARLTARLENNLVNKDGYQAGVQVSVSQINKEAAAYVSRPWRHPVNDKLSANIKYYEEDIEQKGTDVTLSSRTLEGGVARTQVRPSQWNKSYFLRYRLDELKSNAPPELWQDFPIHFSTGRATQEAVLIGASLSKTIQDSLSLPLSGYRQFYSLEAGSRSVMSDTDMLIAKAGIGGMYSFGDNAYGQNRAHQLVGRLDAGYLWAKDFESVPYKLRFFAGGDQSVRGYNHQSLSPVNEAGYLTGGQALAVGSVEYSYEFKEGLRLALFADAGSAYDKDFSNDTKVGAGVGVRWASPVGVVRVDIAKGIEKENTPVRLHFLIGLPF